MNGYPDILINSTHSIQPCLESTSVLSDDMSDDGQETGRDTTTKKPTSKKSPVVLPFKIHPCDPTVVICYLIWPCDTTVRITYLVSHSSCLSYHRVIKGYFRLGV